MKPWKLDVRAAGGDASQLELVVYDVIGADFFGGGVTPQAVLEKLRTSPEAKKIVLRINSVGGVLDDAKSIGNLLAERVADGVDVEARIDGVAASAAAYLATFASRVVMPDNAFMMIHRARAGTRGNADDFAAAAKVLSDNDAIMAEAFAAASARRGKAKSKDDFMQAISKADRYFRATEAIEWGLADQKIAAVKAVACAVPLEDLAEDAPEELRGAPYVGSAAAVVATNAGDALEVTGTVTINSDVTIGAGTSDSTTGFLGVADDTAALGTQTTLAFGEQSVAAPAAQQSEQNTDNHMSETVQVTPSIARALGLPAGATETDCVSAAARNHELEVQVIAITGAPSSTEALGAVRALKVKADRCDAVEAKLREVEAERDQQNFDALIMKGKSAPVKLTPATAKFYTERFDAAKAAGCGANVVAELKGFIDIAPTVIAERVSAPAIASSGSAPSTYNGKTYAEMKYAERARLSKDEPELFRAMKQAHEERA